ncbi:MAG: hypothetical protein JW795_24015 [Chitinivibrionales bacterium]|nr:hypothetical protein [Chitinivibrionales bacterium]
MIMKLEYLFFTLAVAVGSIFSAPDYRLSIREIMDKEVTDTSKLQLFYISHSSAYEKRYIVQYIPDFLTKFEIKQAPGWIVNALDTALSSSDGPLSAAAAMSIGKLNMSEFADRLAAEFVDAPKKKGGHFLDFQVAVLDALPSLDQEKNKKNLSKILKSHPKEVIFGEVFDRLMNVTMLFGDSTHIKELEKFEVSAKKLADQNKSNKLIHDQIVEVIDRVTKIKKAVSEKGGKHE